MKPSIKNLTRLMLWSFMMVSLTGGGMFLYHLKQMAVVHEVRQVAGEWNGEVVDLIVLSSELVQFKSERSERQWYAKYRRLAGVIENYKDNLDSLDIHATQIFSIEDAYSRLPALTAKIISQGTGEQSRNLYMVNLQSHLQWMIKSSMVITQRLIDDEKEMRSIFQLIFIALFIMLVLISVAIYALLNRWIERPIDQLVGDISTLGRGDLSSPINPLATLELKIIAEAVDRARQQLSQLTYSRDQLEQEVEMRTRDLQTALNDLEGFSYSVSHDLRSPLRAIDGFISILEEDYAPKLDEEGLRLLGVVSDNARKMGQLIDDILAFSRVGRLELQITDVDMNALVNEVWQSLAEERREKEYRFYCENLPNVEGDPHSLRQVWQNLLANAIKFSRGRDPAEIRVSATEPDDEHIRYSVADNGVGFNPEYIGNLFVLFQRLHGMDEFEGTGVGLAVIKRFIQKHGGEVAADAVPDEGATFSFTLPKRSEPKLSSELLDDSEVPSYREG